MSQRQRQAAGLLPQDELLELAHSVLFRRFKEAGYTVSAELGPVEHADEDCEAETKTKLVGQMDDAHWTSWQKLASLAAEQAEKPMFEEDAVSADPRRWTRYCTECEAEHGVYEAQVEISWAGFRLQEDYLLDPR